MKKNVIHLNEGELRRIIKESVKTVLMEDNRWNKKVQERVFALMQKMNGNDNCTMYELLENEPADGLTLWEAHDVFMAIEKKWYNARNYYSAEGQDMQDITPEAY